MWIVELPAMRKLLLALSLFLVSCALAQEESPRQFAEQLREIIVSNDTAAFRVLPCLPSPCIDQDGVDYIFGVDGEESGLVHLLRRTDIKVKVFGPLKYDASLSESQYVVVYYDPDIVKFDRHGHMSEKDRENLWWNGYVETVVVPHSGEWAFYRTPFYYGAHLPWAEDY